ncbi:MAG: hypothetical protein KF716_08645 [Anaerolineae bacterium]|nr:hypothetical protein [Anaerolineae bacterium]
MVAQPKQPNLTDTAKTVQFSSSRPKSDEPCQWCADQKSVAVFVLDDRREVVPVSGHEAFSPFDPRGQWMKAQGVLGMDEFQHQHPEAECLGIQTCRCISDARMRDLLKGSQVPPRIARYSMADFHSLPDDMKAGKEVAIAIAQQLCEADEVPNDETGEVKFGAVFSGKAGLGKTVLAAQPVIERVKRGEAAIWIRWSDMITSVQSLYGKSQTADYSGPTPDDAISKLQRAPFLCIDELFVVRDDQNQNEQVPPISPDQLRITMNIIDYRYNYYLPTVIPTNLTERQIAQCSSTPLLQRLQEMFWWVQMDGEPLRFWRRA